MSKEAQIPLFLWIATAVVAHILWGGGVDRVADVIQEGVEIRDFAASVRRHVRGDKKPIEVALFDENETTKEPEAKPEDKPADDQVDPDDKSADEDEVKPEPKPAPTAEKEKKKPDPKPDDEKKKEEEQKIVVEKAEERAPEPEPAEKKRVAVRQHVKDPAQPDNPNADFMADEANHVKEQSQARITSTDQNDPLPTPGAGAKHTSPSEAVGDSDETKILQSEDRKGEKGKAPGSEPPAQELRIAAMPTPAVKAPGATGPERLTEGAKQGAPSAEPDSKLPAQKGQTARAETHEAEAVPDTLDSAQGGWQVSPERQASTEQAGRAARKKRSLPPLRSRGVGDLLGLGATGTTPGGLNLNLTPQVAVAAIGKEQLTRELRADGERRKSQHAGKWRPVGIERWRSAIENYVPSVKPGNQTALNTARVPFASYLNQVHSRIHPIFADQFLASLDSLPATDPQNRRELSTNLEIVLDRDDGRVHRLGVTKASGVTAFDVNALDSVYRAQPFGPPPREIVSPDGFVYFHWEFHRDDQACGTWNARPFILKGVPKSVPPVLEPQPSPDSETQERHGLLGRDPFDVFARADENR